VIIAAAHAVDAQQARLLEHVFAARGERAALATGAEILRRVETEGAAVPPSPTGVSRYRAPTACAQSSTTNSPWRRATAMSSSMGAGWPKRCTITTPLVRGPTSAASCAGSRLKVPSSTSAKRGVAPTVTHPQADEMKLKAGTMTSSPGPKPPIIEATCNGDVPLFMPMTRG